MSQNLGGQSVGRVSADGQFRWDGTQWVTLPPGYREPTSWTRPMQIGVAAIFAVNAVLSVVTSLLFINHDTMIKAVQAQGQSIPPGSSIDDVVNFAVAATYAVVIFFAILSVVAAIGSFLGWRWMFWAALVLLGFGGLGAFTNLRVLFNPSTSPMPVGGLIVSELLSLATLGMFIWMVVGLVKFGPWAMRKPIR